MPEVKEYREAHRVDRIYFVVFPNGRKRWEPRYKKPSGKWSFMGLGGYPEVSARKAREKAGQAMAMIDQGVDPVEKKTDDAQASARSLHTTFRAAGEAWFAKKSDEGLAKGSSIKSAPIWTRTFFQRWATSNGTKSPGATAPKCSVRSCSGIRITWPRKLEAS